MTVCSWRFDEELKTAVEAQMFPKELNTRGRGYFIKNFISIFFLSHFAQRFSELSLRFLLLIMKQQLHVQ